MTRQQKLEKLGYTFIWAESAYVVCVRFRGGWIGTFDMHGKRPYSIPSDEMLNV